VVPPRMAARRGDQQELQQSRRYHRRGWQAGRRGGRHGVRSRDRRELPHHGRQGLRGHHRRSQGIFASPAQTHCDTVGVLVRRLCWVGNRYNLINITISRSSSMSIVMQGRRRLLSALAVAGFALACAIPAYAQNVTVFAAASLKDALDEIDADYAAKGGSKAA